MAISHCGLPLNDPDEIIQVGRGLFDPTRNIGVVLTVRQNGFQVTIPCDKAATLSERVNELYKEFESMTVNVTSAQIN